MLWARIDYGRPTAVNTNIYNRYVSRKKQYLMLRRLRYSVYQGAQNLSPRAFMRTLALLSLALTLCSAKKAGAQPLAEGAFFTGVQLINITTGKKARQPMMYIWEHQSMKLDKYLVLGADITLTKNTVPYSQEQGKVLEFYQLNLPVHLDIRAAGNWFVEMGVYLGATARSRNVYITEFVQVKYFEELEMRFDAGCMAGLSLLLNKWGKLHLRYNHGLFPTVPINGGRIEKDRMVTAGVTVSF